jgi:hypothetical protein
LQSLKFSLTYILFVFIVTFFDELKSPLKVTLTQSKSASHVMVSLAPGQVVIVGQNR